MTWATPKTSSAARGYGASHARARAAAAARHNPSDPCARCGHALGPMGPWLHWDHTDRRDGYLGFSHKRCNIRAGAQKAQRRSHIKRKLRKIITADRW